MKLVIEDKEYNLAEALQKPSLLTLMELQAKAGVGMKSLINGSKKLQGMEALDILDDPEALRIFAAIIWLARKHAGEKITFEESSGVPLDSYKWSMDPEVEEEPAADPTGARTDSVRADEPAPARKTTSRTSKAQSSKTSSP
ncbi:hypothetical protein [Arthrobacter sp. HLT1-21]